MIDGKMEKWQGNQAIICVNCGKTVSLNPNEICIYCKKPVFTYKKYEE